MQTQGIFRSDIPRNKNGFISYAKALTVGRVYLIKDGRLLIYLGHDTMDNFVFYHLCNMAIHLEYNHQGNKYDSVYIYNESLQLHFIMEMAKELINIKLDTNCFESLIGLPTILEEFECISFEQTYKKWLAKNKLFMKDNQYIPDLVSEDSSTSTKIQLMKVKSKDLQVGKAYVCGKSTIGTRSEGWRNTYVYLGRTKQGNYMWIFVGCPKDFKANPLGTIETYRSMYGIETTKQNKDVFECTYYTDLPIIQLHGELYNHVQRTIAYL